MDKECNGKDMGGKSQWDEKEICENMFKESSHYTVGDV